jgi:hypothetical protein
MAEGLLQMPGPRGGHFRGARALSFSLARPYRKLAAAFFYTNRRVILKLIGTGLIGPGALRRKQLWSSYLLPEARSRILQRICGSFALYQLRLLFAMFGLSRSKSLDCLGLQPEDFLVLRFFCPSFLFLLNIMEMNLFCWERCGF